MSLPGRFGALNRKYMGRRRDLSLLLVSPAWKLSQADIVLIDPRGCAPSLHCLPLPEVAQRLLLIFFAAPRVGGIARRTEGVCLSRLATGWKGHLHGGHVAGGAQVFDLPVSACYPPPSAFPIPPACLGLPPAFVQAFGKGKLAPREHRCGLISFLCCQSD